MANHVSRRGLGLLLACGLAIGVPTAFGQKADAPPPAAAPIGAIEKDRDDRYFRRVDDADAGKVILQMAVRRFERVGQPGPTVTMCAAVHVGDKPFYDQLQALLDAKDVVLFEGVKPPGTGRPEHALKDGESDDAKIKSTKMRLRMLATAARVHERKTGELPATMAELQAGLDGKYRTYFDMIGTDAWGHSFVYEAKPAPTKEPAADEPAATRKPAPKPWGKLEVISLGADGEPGGEGPAADIKLSEQKPIRPKDLPDPKEKGIQSDLASALGLVFQLDVMTHDGPNWRNSDLSIDQVQERLSTTGEDPDQLFKMLDGSSMQASILKLMLGFVRMMPGMQTMGKLMMLEVLDQADQLMTAVPGMEKTMEVILHDRNAVVLDDLRNVIEKESGKKTIGIIYGGAHMAGLEEGLAELGYREAGVEWLDAITVQLPSNPAERRQIESMRKTIREALEKEVQKAKRRKAKE
ncbi:MAG: type II secretion system protein GspG [Phycisphaerales bacterium]|nr:type II secretion system protein GspG [Phycisphaerales bacterium]